MCCPKSREILDADNDDNSDDDDDDLSRSAITGFTTSAVGHMLHLDADNDDNEEEEEGDDGDDDISRDKLGFTTSAGGHLLPLHNHNLWRELVGWRLSSGKGWRETKNILGRRGGGGEKHKI